MSPTTEFVDVEDEVNNNESEKCDDDGGSPVRVFPYEIRKVDEDTNAELLKVFTGEHTGFVQVGPKQWFFPSGFERNAHHYYNFKLRQDDVFIVTFPRSGTTWAQEMVWLIANNLNYQGASEIPLVHRFPFLEFSSFVHKKMKSKFLDENRTDPEKYQVTDTIDYPGWRQLSETSERRFVKTHLPFSLLPPNLLEVGCKVIYIARNPKDVAVSFYHLNRLIRTQGYIGNFPNYWNYFQRNLQPWTPYWEHVKEGWNRRNEENLLFLFYEDMSKNLRCCLKKVSKLLGKFYSSKQYDALEEHLKIENFRKNKSVNYDVLKDIGVLNSGEQGFIRNGKSGDWKDYFDEELNAKADRWIEANLQDTELRFPQVSQ